MTVLDELLIAWGALNVSAVLLTALASYRREPRAPGESG